MVGKAFTDPLATIFCAMAPVLVIEILPDGEPVADDVKRMYIIVLFTVPPDCVSVILVVKPLADVVETSNPIGAVITILFVRFDPPTVKLCSADVEPEHDSNVVNVPDVVISGTADTTITVK
jgi:hypothetical protein